MGRFEACLSGGGKKLFFMSIMEATMKTGPQESFSVDSEFRVDHQKMSAINGNISFPPTSHVIGVNHKLLYFLQINTSLKLLVMMLHCLAIKKPDLSSTIEKNKTKL